MKTVNTEIIEREHGKPIFIDYPYLLLLTVLIIIHLFCITKVGLAQTVAALEAIIVLVFFVQKKIAQTVLLLGIFILTSYDNSFFFAEPVGVKDVYSVSLLPVVSIYYYLLLSFVIFFISACQIVKKKIKLNNLLVKFSIFTLLVMIPLGFVSHVTDGTSSLAITRDIKNNVIPVLWSISFFVLFYTNKNLVYRYERLILHILLAYVVVGVITSSFGFFLVRGNRMTLLYLPLASFFYTSVILFLYKIPRKADKIFVLIMFGFSVFFQLFLDNCLGGKSWFVFVSVILLGVYFFVQRVAKGIMAKLFFVLFVLIAGIVFSPRISSFVTDTENNKLLEFASLFEGAQTGDVDDVGASAQFRILEFITISDYFLKHPQYLLLGKGVGGGVPNSGFFVYSETAFSDDQYKSNQFSVMHESINVVFLKCGLIGLVFLVISLVDGFKRIKYDPLFFIGIVWLFFYWAYSINLLFIGLPAFLIAYRKMEKNKDVTY